MGMILYWNKVRTKHYKNKKNKTDMNRKIKRMKTKENKYFVYVDKDTQKDNSV